MSDVGWLVVAIVAGVLFVFGWIKRERWIAAGEGAARPSALGRLEPSPAVLFRSCYA